MFQIDGKGKGVITGWPHRVDAVFQGLEGNLDAAVTRKNGKTYFFKVQIKTTMLRAQNTISCKGFNF